MNVIGQRRWIFCFVSFFFGWWLKVFGKKLLSNFNDSFVCTTQFEYAFGH